MRWHVSALRGLGFSGALLALFFTAPAVVGADEATPVRLKKDIEIAGEKVSLDALPERLSLLADPGVVVPAGLCEVQPIGTRAGDGSIFSPRAVKAANGDYLAFGVHGGYYQSSVKPNNAPILWRSTDQGRSWDQGVRPWTQDASEHCLVPIVDPAQPERILVFGNASRDQQHAAGMVLRHSDDNGHTWSAPSAILPENDPAFPGAPIHMRGAVLGDGTWLWGAYYRDINTIEGDRQFLLRSTDKGATWTVLPAAAPGGWYHPTWNKFMEGIVVPGAGTQATFYLRAPGGRMYEKRTTDSGLTWTDAAEVPGLLHPDAPPMVFRFDGGKRLIAFIHNRYDKKHPHHYHPDRVELWFATSADEGRSWSEPRFIIAQAKHTDHPLSCDPDVSYVDLLVDEANLHLFVGDGQRQAVQVSFSADRLEEFPTRRDLAGRQP